MENAYPSLYFYFIFQQTVFKETKKNTQTVIMVENELIDVSRGILLYLS